MIIAILATTASDTLAHYPRRYRHCLKYAGRLEWSRWSYVPSFGAQLGHLVYFNPRKCNLWLEIEETIVRFLRTTRNWISSSNLPQIKISQWKLRNIGYLGERSIPTITHEVDHQLLEIIQCLPSLRKFILYHARGWTITVFGMRKPLSKVGIRHGTHRNRFEGDQ